MAPALVACMGTTIALAPRHAAGPPPGHTGGFGEPTCQACHEGTELNLEGGVLGVDGLPPQYEPGARYRIAIVLQNEDMGRAGFQGAFRYADGPERGRPAGRVEPHDARTTVQRSSDGVEYISHSDPGSEVDSPILATWTFIWTAPSGDAPVVFHAAGNAANGDNSPFADLIYTVTQRVDGPAPTPPSAGGSGRPGNE